MQLLGMFLLSGGGTGTPGAANCVVMATAKPAGKAFSQARHCWVITLHPHEVGTHIAAFQRANTTFYQCNVQFVEGMVPLEAWFGQRA
jgi:hypothetical protein